MTSSISIIVSAWILVSAVMAALWLVEWNKTDAGIVDVGWSSCLGLTALFYACVSSGTPGRRLLLAALAGLWAFRLAFYLLFNRVIGKPEDGRYQNLRRHWGARQHPYFFLFFEFQAVLVILFAIPFLAVCVDPRPVFGPREWIGIAIWIAAVSGEAVADRQLAVFRSNPANKGLTCRNGLWRYSRHPNYFFEWVHWWTYVALGAGSPYFAWTLIGPALMFVFLYKVTGIPYTEAQALKHRPDYAQYQKTTSAFIPWFPTEA